MSIKFKSNEQGKCPLCNSMNLSYDTLEIDDGLGNSCYYPWHCDDCGADGKEWYYIDFSEIIANTSDGDVTGNEEGVCPECGEGINYFSSEPDGESLGYEFECPACGVSGTEWYDMSFDSHTIDGHEDEVIDVMTEAIQKQESKKVTEETNLEPIVSSINADSCKVNGDIVTGSAELVQYDGSEYNPVSDEFTFEYNRKDKTIKVTSDNKKEIVRDLDEEEIMNNIEDNILPEITKITEGKNTKVSELLDLLDKVNITNNQRAFCEFTGISMAQLNGSQGFNERNAEVFIPKVKEWLNKKELGETIDYRNDRYIATTAEDPEDDREYFGKYMTKRDKVRSFDQAKRNLDRMEKDPRVTQGQAVDQISFDSALNSDLSYYKDNKDMARLDKEQGNDFWANEHNKTAKEFADKIRAKHTAKTENEIIDVSDRLCKVQEDTQQIKLSNKMKSIDIKKPDDDIDGNETVDVKGKYGNMKSIKVDKDKLSVTPSIANQINKKQEELETDDIDEPEEEEPDIDFNDTISLLDIALSEIPVVGVEDWGKDNELKFVADTKALFEGLKPYEEEIPRYFYDNADSYDWSNGVDEYLETIVGIDPENDGESNNTYNWNAPVTHNVEFTTYKTDDGCYYKASIHRAGDVRGNYTTEFLLKFDSIDACYEQIMESCMENCSNEIEVDGKRYGIDPNFFGETVTIYDFETQESYDDVYCTEIDDLKKIVAGEN